MKHEFFILGTLGTIGLLLFIALYPYALPSASIHLSLSRNEIRRIARAFLSEHHLQVQNMKEAVLFTADDDASVFLQKVIGLEKTNQVQNPEQDVFVPLFFWDIRYFKPLQKEEYKLSIMPNGKIIRFLHLLPEEEAGAKYPQSEAQRKALEFLTKEMAFSPSEYDLVKASSEEKKNRTDHYFTWKRKSPTFGDADLRVNVTISGNQITEFFYYLKVPEKFTRDYQAERSRGSLIAGAAFFLSLILFIGAFYYFFVLFRRRQLDYRLSLLASILVGIGPLLTGLNFFPMWNFQYSTDIQYATFLFMLIFGVLLEAGGLAFFIFVAIGVGSGLASMTEKERLLKGLREMSRGRWLTRSLWTSALSGYFIAFCFLGYDAVLYTLGRKYFGVWMPAENEFTSAYGAFIPAIAPIFISLTAGFWEEAFFRFAGFLILKRWVRWAPLAALIPTVLWAFAHSTYSVFPVYFRGIELTIGGLLFFFFFWRYGLLTVVFAHFFIDTIYFSIPLLKAPSLSFYLSGILAVGIGVIPITLGFLGRRQRFLLVPDIPPINPESALMILRQGIQAGAIPPVYIEKLMGMAGVTESTPLVKTLFIAREILGLSVRVEYKGNTILFHLYKASPYQHFLGQWASPFLLTVEGEDLLLSCPAEEMDCS